jgi:hypothetical protein
LITVYDNEIARLKFDFSVPGRIFLHLKPFAEPTRVILWIMSVREDVAEMLDALGYTKVEVVFPANPRVERLCQLIGFKTLHTLKGWTFMEAFNGSDSG